MPRGNKFRFTVTIQDIDIVYRNSYFNNILNYVYSIMARYYMKVILRDVTLTLKECTVLIY